MEWKETDDLQLSRGVEGYDWDARSLSFQETMPTLDISSSQVMGEGIFRFEFTYMLNDNVDTNSIIEDGSGAKYREGMLTPTPPPDPTAPGRPDFRAIQGVIVTVAAIDLSNREIVGDLSSLASKFPDVNNDETPLERWKPIAENASNFPGIPARAANSIRLYQRIFRIDSL